MNYRKAFDNMHPRFFDSPYIKTIPEDSVYAELIMDLRSFTPAPLSFSIPEYITFGLYNGSMVDLKKTVSRVDEEWSQFFCDNSRAFCAFDGDKVVSFCILEDWGRQDGLMIGGPGCVGTIPEYRKKGIGLEMVRRATMLLKEENFDISWIHYTHLRHWYEKLGYRTILEWNSKGFL